VRAAERRSLWRNTPEDAPSGAHWSYFNGPSNDFAIDEKCRAGQTVSRTDEPVPAGWHRPVVISHPAKLDSTGDTIIVGMKLADTVEVSAMLQQDVHEMNRCLTGSAQAG
jgi:hypothetical protein